MVAGGGIEPPTRGFSAVLGGSTGLIINHLQRLPAPTPASPRHNPGTPNLSSSHSWHTAGSLKLEEIADRTRPSEDTEARDASMTWGCRSANRLRLDLSQRNREPPVTDRLFSTRGRRTALWRRACSSHRHAAPPNRSACRGRHVCRSCAVESSIRIWSGTGHWRRSYDPEFDE